MNLISKIRQVITDPLESLGFGIVQIKFIEKETTKLEILIERLDFVPITVEECMKANRVISTHLDVEDLIHKAYMLEVSSAGIDRPLIERKDYERFVGYKVMIQTLTPVMNSKKFKGFLTKVDEDDIYLETETPVLDEILKLSFHEITKGKLDLDYMIELKMKERKKLK